LHLDTKGAAGVEANHYGWNGALSLNANRWFGITADLSGHYRELAPGVSFNSFTAVFGPQLTYRAEKASPFVHALFGVNRASTGGLSDSAFAMALGGGLDINITKRLAFRLVQADYLMTKHSDDTQNNIRSLPAWCSSWEAARRLPQPAQLARCSRPRYLPASL
jgi:hypothetical protein